MSWRRMGFGGKNETAKPRKQYSTATQKRLSELKKASFHTLGSNQLHILCQTPDNEQKNDWIALHILDFFNELQMLAEIATTHEDAAEFNLPGKGFPRGVMYKWKEGRGKKAHVVSGPEYINFTITYIEAILDDPTIFPADDPPVYSETFIPEMKKIYTKMFRIYAILYGAFLETMKKVEVLEHLNTSFKHFMYFAYAHGLTPIDKETAPMSEKVAQFHETYHRDMKRDKGLLNKRGVNRTGDTKDMQEMAVV